MRALMANDLLRKQHSHSSFSLILLLNNILLFSVEEASKAKLCQAEEKLKELKEKSKRNESSLESKLAELRLELEAKEELLSAERARFGSTERQHKSEMEKAEQRFEALQREHKNAVEQLEQSKKAAEVERENQTLTKQVAEIGVELKMEREEHEKLKVEYIKFLSVVEAEKKTVDSTMAASTKQRLALQSDLEEAQQVITKLSLDLSNAEEANAELEKQVQKEVAGSNKRMVADQTIEAQKGFISALTEERNNAREKHRVQMLISGNLRRELDALKKGTAGLTSELKASKENHLKISAEKTAVEQKLSVQIKAQNDTKEILSKFVERHAQSRAEIEKLKSSVEAQTSRNKMYQTRVKSLEESHHKLSLENQTLHSENRDLIVSNQENADKQQKKIDSLSSSLARKENAIETFRREIEKCFKEDSLTEENALRRVDVLRQRVDKIIHQANDGPQ